MKRQTTSSYKIYANATNTIAFWPAIISVGFLALALAMLYFETTALSTFLEKRLPFMLAREEENARLILNIVAAGTISLTVFSFSMVMIVLSQASSNLTPRVIPRLATVRAHQVVLGFYIGTILYSMIILLNFRKEAAGEESTPAIAVLVSLLCGLISIILFVYFIHSISKTIQVDNIINHIFIKAYDALELEKKESEKFKSKGNSQEPEKELHLIKSSRNGYLKLIELKKLLDIACKYNLQLFIQAEVGAFIVEGMPVIKVCSPEIPDKNLTAELEKCFHLSLYEVIMEDFEQGVKQLSEIAVKALSPGINDPGTAIKVIDFLTLLFLHRIKIKTNNCLYEHENLRVTERIITLDELLFRYITPIRTYGKGDIQINLRLLKCMQSLLLTDGQSIKFKESLTKHIKAILFDSDKNISNTIDRISLNETIQHLNELLPPRHKLDLLQL